MTTASSGASNLPSAVQTARHPLKVACGRIAPTFPLDRFIAVNPYWGFVDQPIELAGKRLGLLSGARFLMPRAWYRERYRNGELTLAHLQTAIERAGSQFGPADLVRQMEREASTERGISLITHLADESRDSSHDMSWAHFVTHSISQLCASYFDAGQAAWSRGTGAGLYQAWRAYAQADRSPGILMDSPELRRFAAALPQSHQVLLETALQELGVPESRAASYLSALLLDINGWAAWCAYRRFQARLTGGDDDAIEQLVAVRLAWELLLLRREGDTRRDQLLRDWSTALERLPAEDAEPTLDHEANLDWLLQSATEVSFQEQLVAGLRGGAPSGDAPPPTEMQTPAPTAQVLFCIDVRSEPFRRALEQASPQVQTLGFAGFFGLPIEYAPLGTELVQAQLPGLLAARLQVRDVAEAPETARRVAEQRRSRLGRNQGWLGFQRSATSGFAFVEAIGLGYAAKLVRDSFGLARATPLDEAGLTASQIGEVRPRLVSTKTGAEVELTARVELVAGILNAASLKRNFGRLVVFAGHASESANNPHAAGLDCGACSGHSGAVNARVLAALLNDRAIRAGLVERGVVIPETTHFLGALHNTTTDQLRLYETNEAPGSHRQDIAQLEQSLCDAGRRTRAERAPSLALEADDATLLSAVRRRARDWAEVRPEWGLVNNAAFVVAPRARTASLNLGGRVFLHDYRFQDDQGFGVLELIMTAPMIVTHWINMQYYASTVDNPRYGSGNKVLHNVVGGHLGVFEGNGGDLRIGLSLQSVHDGREFRHTPLRLSVFIEAPASAIDGVIERHQLLKQLVENRWLHLFRVAGPEIKQRRGDAWLDV